MPEFFCIFQANTSDFNTFTHRCNVVVLNVPVCRTLSMAYKCLHLLVRKSFDVMPREDTKLVCLQVWNVHNIYSTLDHINILRFQIFKLRSRLNHTPPLWRGSVKILTTQPRNDNCVLMVQIIFSTKMTRTWHLLN